MEPFLIIKDKSETRPQAYIVVLLESMLHFPYVQYDTHFIERKKDVESF